MKIQVTFKDPDGVSDSIREAARDAFRDVKLDDDELEDCIARRSSAYEKYLEKWIKYGEYVTIEFDTEKHTAIVLKN